MFEFLLQKCLFTLQIEHSYGVSSPVKSKILRNSEINK